MSTAAIEDIFINPERHDFRPQTHLERGEVGESMSRLVACMIAKHDAYKADPQSAVFDPIVDLMDLKYHLIGDTRPIARYNLTFPPGVERETARGRRVYGVECAALVDPDTGWVGVLRKDDVVDSRDKTDWLLVQYNVLSGVHGASHALGGDIVEGIEEDVVQLVVDPPSDIRYAHQGPSTLTMTVDKMYHAASSMVLSRQKYYGRGTGQEEPLVEVAYTHDISALFEELERQQQAEQERERQREFGNNVVQLSIRRI